MNHRVPFRSSIVGMSLTIVLVAAFAFFPALWAESATVPRHVSEAVSRGEAIWVFLHDKGPEAAAAQGSGPLISERAALRIRRRGGNVHSEQNLPVSSAYRRQLEAAGLAVETESRWLNSVSGKIQPEQLTALAAVSCVDSLRAVTTFHRRHNLEPEIPTLPHRSGESDAGVLDYGFSESQVRTIEADRLHEIGLDGSGVMIGFLDTGFDTSISAFSSLDVIATRDFLNGDEDVGDGDKFQMEHGTATLSVCGGYSPGELIGIAPKATYALAKTEYANQEIQIEESYWIAGLEWADSIGCDILSSSLGYTDWYEYADLDGHTAPSTIAANMAAARGLLVVTAAGNEGDDPWHYIIVPGDGDSVLTVGGVTPEGVRAGFSSFGPTADGRIKPDVMAQGSSVWSSNPITGTVSPKGGTSFSTPLVAGVCALLLQDKPELTPYELITRLRTTATQAGSPDNEMGYGIVRAGVAAGLAERFETERVELWPNPTEGFTLIVTPSELPDRTNEFRVFTMAGEPVYSGRFVGPRGHWNAITDAGDPVVSGVYVIWVRTDLGDEVVKLAVRREGS